MKHSNTQFIVGGMLLLLFLSACKTAIGQQKEELKVDNVLLAMRKASDFMANTVSFRGGYLWKYAEDFSEREGEAPARESQIMVQGGTPEMGHVLLDLFDATGDKAYLDYALNAADALVYGQHELGGWNYLIDFDPKGIDDYYKDVSSSFVLGMEEYRHYYGNCTYDDNATQGATAFLLRVYEKTLLPQYLKPLQNALEFMLISQYPNGGWPQRYPLRYEFVHDGLPDYTSMYTLNDNAMSNTIDVLLEAYEQLGESRYLEAARRGGDFFIISQGPEGHTGWAEQYDMNLQPCWARTHEPPGYMPRQTLNTIHTLEKLYLTTGDRRFLRPIPAAIDWLNNSALRVMKNGSIEVARLYEPDSNLPIKVDVLKERSEEGYDLYDFKAVDIETYLEARAASARDPHAVVKQVQGRISSYDLRPVIDRYQKISAASPEDLSGLYNDMFGPRKRRTNNPGEREISEIINKMNENGAWIEDVEIWDYKPGQMIEKKKTIRGINVGNYIRNMNIMLAYLSNH